MILYLMICFYALFLVVFNLNFGASSDLLALHKHETDEREAVLKLYGFEMRFLFLFTGQPNGFLGFPRLVMDTRSCRVCRDASRFTEIRGK